MKVYLAGPMRGLPGWNFDAFDAAEQRWRQAGHHVFSPATIARALGYTWGQTAPVEPGTPEGNCHLRHVLQSDISCLMHSDSIALLPGWENSRGATVEVAVAQFLGLPFFDAETMLMMEVEPKKTPWADLKSANQYITSRLWTYDTVLGDSSKVPVCTYCTRGLHSYCTNMKQSGTCSCVRCSNEATKYIDELTKAPRSEMLCPDCEQGYHQNCSNYQGGMICLCLLCKAERVRS